MEYDHEYKHERKDRLLEIDLIFLHLGENMPAETEGGLPRRKSSN